MNSRTVYCPNCERSVELDLTAVPLHGGQATLPDSPEAVCLEFDDGCTSDTCPVLRVRRTVAGVRLARSGLRPDRFDAVVSVCQACDRPTELKIVDDDYAVCTLCGATNPAPATGNDAA